MKKLVSLVYSLVIFQTLVASASIPAYFQTFPITRPQLNVTNVQQELGSRVSDAAVIFGPNDSRYNESTTRWNIFAVPQIQIVIEPGQESDISTIVSAMSMIIEACKLTVIQGQLLQ